MKKRCYVKSLVREVKSDWLLYCEKRARGGICCFDCSTPCSRPCTYSLMHDGKKECPFYMTKIEVFLRKLLE